MPGRYCFTASYSGFKNRETLATSGVTGAPSLTTTAVANSAVGDYTITVAQGTLASANYSFSFANGTLHVTPATLTVTANDASRIYGDANPSFSASYSGFKNGETLATSGVTGSPSLTTAATQATVPGSYDIIAAKGTLAATNYAFAFAKGTLTIVARHAPVAYIGQTLFYTSGSSSTSAQVTLSASVQDTTGSGADLNNATVTFTDLLSGKVLASGVKVTPVQGSTVPTGTANTIVTLSSGQYGAQENLIQVSLGNMFQNCQQTGPFTTPGSLTPSCSGWPAVSSTDPAYQAAHPTVSVMIPPTQYSMQGAASIGTGAPYTPAGKYGDATPVSYTVGMQYNNKGTNPQGQVQLVLQRADGTYYVKSNSITSFGFIGNYPSKDVTIQTKASIYKVSNSGVLTSVDGNVSVRVDAHEGCTTSPTCSSSGGDTIGFTVLSSKDSSLYYSNNWQYDPTTKAWKTVQEPVSAPNGTAVVIN